MESHKSSYSGAFATCFFSHKCDDRNSRTGERHKFATLVGDMFRRHGLELLVDPFSPGVEVGARIRAIDFQALVFLCCPKSLDSEACKEELRIAQQKSVPVFVIRWRGKVPKEHRDRMFLDLPRVAGDEREKALGELASQIHPRAVLYREIRALGRGESPELHREAAQRVADIANRDPTAMAEFLEMLVRECPPGLDERAHYWLALALGRTGDPDAVNVLRQWGAWENLHPLVQAGIRESLQALGCDPATGVTRRTHKRTWRLLKLVFIALAVSVAARGMWHVYRTANEIDKKLLRIEELLDDPPGRPRPFLGRPF